MPLPLVGIGSGCIKGIASYSKITTRHLPIHLHQALLHDDL